MTNVLLLDVSSLMYRAFFAWGQELRAPDGQHVGAHFVEDQEHLRRPAADAFDLDQRLDQRFVVHPAPGPRIESSGDEVRR